ncbi:MAG: hypothetical protein E4H09_04820 [Spirochaetales bacterium]|nr:MAG: hypothetical protein E4H09_04820 [Spirochaetales bacterium]
MIRQTTPQPALSTWGILLFWLPLGAMWLMMAAEQPVVTAIVARMGDAQTNLAAFGVVMAIALVAESPIIQMLSAATALANNRQNYWMLMRFMLLMAVALTVIHLLIGLTPLFDFIVRDLMGVPDAVADASRIPFIVMAPFSASVGYRRLWQGVLIRHGKTWIVPVSMIARLATLGGVLALGYAYWPMSGALLASVSMISAVIVAAIIAGVLNRTLVMPSLPEPTTSREHLGWKQLLAFYVPLSMTTVIYLLAGPVLTSGIARGADPSRSLAVWPVVNGFTFLCTSIALSYQEAAIAILKRNPGSRVKLQRFTTGLAISLSVLMLAAALTPFGAWWFRWVSGLDAELLPLTRTPLIILTLVPGFVTYKAWYRALFVGSARTGVLAQGIVVYTLVLFVVMVAGTTLSALAGATVAAAAMTVAQALENGYLVMKKPAQKWLTPAREVA